MSAPTCQCEWYDPDDPDDFFVCGEPAVLAAGLLRSCGCPPSPARYYCDDCLGDDRPGDCAICRADGAVSFVEPVRLKAAS